MKPASYNPTTLGLIRAGASARELGWDEGRYHRVCRAHGLDPVESHRTVAIVPLDPPAANGEPAPPATIKSDPPPKPSPMAFRYYPKSRRVQTKDGHAVELSAREAEFFVHLYAAPSGHAVRGGELAARMNTTGPNIGSIANSLRDKLNSIGVQLQGHRGRDGGYRLTRVPW